MTLEDAQNSPKSQLCLPNLVERDEVTGVTGRRICPSSYKNSSVFYNGIFLGAAQVLAGVCSPVEALLSGKGGARTLTVNPISNPHLSLKMNHTKKTKPTPKRQQLCGFVLPPQIFDFPGFL